jgi:hypothetical protein
MNLRARDVGLLVALGLVVTTLPATPPVAAAGARAGGAVLAGATWQPVPSYAKAAHDEPVTYRNGCHAWRPVTHPKACTIVNASAPRTVLLFGDSHAAHWYGAVRAAAVARGWRMLYLTKSSCPAADVPVRGYKVGSSYPQCSIWRRRALPALAESRWGAVDVAVVSDWHFHTVLSSPHGRRLSPARKAVAWEAGMRRTLRALLRGVPQVVLLRDSPDLPGDAATARACFRRHGLAAQKRCGAPATSALKGLIWAAEKRAAASFGGRVTVVDLTKATCTGGWCGPIDKPYLAFKDDNHWTQTYMRAHFTKPVGALLDAAMRKARPTV